MRRQLWATGLSGASLDRIARSARLNRPSLAAAFGDKDAIYAQAAAQFGAIMNARLGKALEAENLEAALRGAFEAAIDTYTADGPNGCFVICTAPADAVTNPICRDVLDRTLTGIDALFLRRLEQERPGNETGLADLAAQLGATLHSVALRTRAGWSRDRVQGLVASTVRQVVAACKDAAVVEASR